MFTRALARALRAKAKMHFLENSDFSLFWLIQRARAARGNARALPKIKYLNSVDQDEQIYSWTLFHISKIEGANAI